MTDNEIIKALEYCNDCSANLNVEIIDLINRQHAEIERLNIENEILSINADTAFQDGLNEAQDLYAEQVKAEIKSEATKEFAYRLKEMWSNNYYDSPDVDFDEFIDNLLKEMVGEE